MSDRKWGPKVMSADEFIGHIREDIIDTMMETLEELADGVDMPFIVSAVNGVVQPVPIVQVRQIMKIIKERFEEKLSTDGLL